MDLFALKSSLARLKIDKKQESLKDLEKCIDVSKILMEMCFQ